MLYNFGRLEDLDVEQLKRLVKGPYTTIDEHLFAKEIVLGDGAKRQRLVLVKNTQEQKRAEETRQKLIQTLEEKDQAFQ